MSLPDSARSTAGHIAIAAGAGIAWIDWLNTWDKVMAGIAGTIAAFFAVLKLARWLAQWLPKPH